MPLKLSARLNNLLLGLFTIILITGGILTQLLLLPVQVTVELSTLVRDGATQRPMPTIHAFLLEEASTWTASVVPAAIPSHLTIRSLAPLGHSGEHAFVNKITGIKTASNGWIPLYREIPPPGWDCPVSQQACSSSTTGSSLRWEGSASDLLLHIQKGPKGGSLAIDHNGVKSTISLNDPTESETTVTLPVSRALAKFSLPKSLQMIKLSSSDHQARVEAIYITIGALELASTIPSPPPLADQYTLDLSSVTTRQILMTIAMNQLRLLGKGILLALAFFLLGLPWCAPFTASMTSIERILVPILVGLATLCCIGTTLALLGFYLYQGVAIALLIAAARYVLALRDYRFSLRMLLLSFFTGTTEESRPPLLLLLFISVGSTTLFFLPAGFLPGLFFGHTYTDTFWYINLAGTMQYEQPWEAFPGKWATHRLADVTTLFICRYLLRSSTLSAYPATACFLWLLLPFISYSLLRRLRLPARSALLGALSISLSADLYSIFTQSYFAQFLEVHVILHSMVAGAILLDNGLSDTRSKGLISLIIAVGSILAYGLLLYPYQQVAPAALGITMILTARREGLRRIMILAGVTLTTIAWANVGLMILIHASENGAFLETLNAFARNFIFPFYNTPKMGAVALGLQDWVLNSQLIPQFASALFGSDEPAIKTWIKLHSLVTWLSIALFFIALPLFLWGLVRGCLSHDKVTRFISVCVLLFIVLAGGLLATDQPYNFGKMAVTLGAVAPFILFTLLKPNSTGDHFKPIQVFTFLLIVVFIPLNIYTQYVDILPIAFGRNASATSLARTHSNIISPSIKTLLDTVRTRDKAQDDGFKGGVALVGTYDEYLGTDKDRNLFWILREVFTGRPLYLTSQSSLEPQVIRGYKANVPESELKALADQGSLRYIFVFNGATRPPLKGFIRTTKVEWGTLYEIPPV